MFKVSFKGEYKKVQTFNDRATLVTLVGEIKISRRIWIVFLEEITDWILKSQSVKVSWGNPIKGSEGLKLEITGKAVCSEGDTFNEVTGQRIAESRAKIKLYKFICTLCKKLMTSYKKIVYGQADHIIPVYNFKESELKEPAPDCLYVTLKVYEGLLIKEFHHLGGLLKEA